MRYNKKYIIFVALLIAFLIGIGEVHSTSDIIIIINKDVKEISLKKNELRSIYLGDKSVWTNGEKINFVILKKGPTHKIFLDAYINKTSKNFVRYWKRQILTGKATMPKLVDSEKEIIKYVSTTDGAIGYVSEGFLMNDIKTINIIK